MRAAKKGKVYDKAAASRKKKAEKWLPRQAHRRPPQNLVASSQLPDQLLNQPKSRSRSQKAEHSWTVETRIEVSRARSSRGCPVAS